MAMGTMGAAGSGTDTDKALQLLELLADPVKSKARIEDYGRREKAAKDAEANSRQATQEARDATTNARQTVDAINQRTAELEQRVADVARREDALRSREVSVERAEREVSVERQRLEAEIKQRNDDFAKRVNEWAAMLSRLG